MKPPFYKELSVNNSPIRVLLTEDSQLWLCVWDIAKALKRPHFMSTNPVFTMVDTARKLKFDSSRDALWAFHRSDVEKYFKSIQNESAYSKKIFDAVVAWAKELTVESFLNSPEEAHSSYQSNVSDEGDAGIMSQVFNYQDAPISFRTTDGAVMINATEMAKPFGKRVNDWLRLPSAQSFIQVLSDTRKSRITNYVITQKGKSELFQQGTWMHEDVALEFARWLSPQFAIWCNDRIKELLKHGVTATPEAMLKLLTQPSSIIQMLQAIQDERDAKEKAIAQRNEARALVEEQKPKAEYYDAVIEDRDLYTTSQIAGELGMSYCSLRIKLYRRGVITSMTGFIKLAPNYQSWGETIPNHRSLIGKSLKWNKEGRRGIFALINPSIPA